MRVLAIGVLLQATAAAQTESCNPASASSANVRLDDAGRVWVGDLPVQSADTPFSGTTIPGMRQPPPMPAVELFGKLNEGNLSGKDPDAPRTQGTYIGDVIRIFGQPNGLTKTLGEGATLLYTWRKPGAVVAINEPPATISMGVQCEWVPSAIGVNPDTKHLIPLIDPYFVTSLDLQSDGAPSAEFERMAEQIRAAWDPILRKADGSIYSTCTECKTIFVDFTPCAALEDTLGTFDIEDCFALEFE